MKCVSCSENDARYITELGELSCGICPLKRGLDAIKFTDVGVLLKWAREVQRGGLIGGSCFEALRSIIGRKPAVLG